MNTMHPYLNFDGQAEEAFNFYKSVFGGEFLMLQKMGDAPDADKIPDNEKNRVMHVALPINEHTILMASDCLPSAGHILKKGNNMYININTDSREEADRLFNGLSADGDIEMPMEDMFWGDYFGSLTDKFGIQWMVNFGSYK
ncbi:VOC family protein [Pedobacter sp.]|uniref:VOC family protein n=1 Tax=Pedobacter sp. TaxID=1411316 RepID=UPI003BA8E040